MPRAGEARGRYVGSAPTGDGRGSPGRPEQPPGRPTELVPAPSAEAVARAEQAPLAAQNHFRPAGRHPLDGLGSAPPVVPWRPPTVPCLRWSAGPARRSTEPASPQPRTQGSARSAPYPGHQAARPVPRLAGRRWAPLVPMGWRAVPPSAVPPSAVPPGPVCWPAVGAARHPLGRRPASALGPALGRAALARRFPAHRGHAGSAGPGALRWRCPGRDRGLGGVRHCRRWTAAGSQREPGVPAQ